MVSRRAIALTCDQCGTKAPRTFPNHGLLAGWMRTRGWAHCGRQDWCAACVMADRMKQLADATQPTLTNGDT